MTHLYIFASLSGNCATNFGTKKPPPPYECESYEGGDFSTQEWLRAIPRSSRRLRYHVGHPTRKRSV